MALRLDRTVAPIMSGKEEWRSYQLQQGSSFQISAATLFQGLSGKGVVMSGSLFGADFVTWQGLQCSIHFCRALPMPGHQALVWHARNTSHRPAAVPLSLTSDVWELQFCRHREVNHGMFSAVSLSRCSMFWHCPVLWMHILASHFSQNASPSVAPGHLLCARIQT